MDFLKNEILGFDENLAVVFLCEINNNVLCCNKPRSDCVRTAPGHVNMVAYGKINTRLSPQELYTSLFRQMYRPYVYPSSTPLSLVCSDKTDIISYCIAST